ncbi:hypothetical protein L083_5109 [Actinoplanes sp. N902-109]|nr:hypothetical protein L083_5109 [Actinoplanes sp. N902-109]
MSGFLFSSAAPVPSFVANARAAARTRRGISGPSTSRNSSGRSGPAIIPAIYRTGDTADRLQCITCDARTTGDAHRRRQINAGRQS